MEKKVKKVVNEQLVEIFVLGMGKFVGCYDLATDDSSSEHRMFSTGGKIIKIRTEHVVAETDLRNVNLNQLVCHCKNDKTGCKGFYWITSKDKNALTEKDVNCPYTKQFDCDFGAIGKLYDLPYELRSTILEGMQTPIPKSTRKKLDDEAKEEKKNGKFDSRV
jgi:hypothetical protein